MGPARPSSLPDDSSGDTPERPRRALWTALALVFLWASAALVYPPMSKYPLFEPGLGGTEGDVGQYVKIYRGRPLMEVARPFRYRLLTPLLARAVPQVPHPLLRYFDVNAEKLIQYRFGVANLIGLALSGLLMVMLCEALGFAAWEGVLAAFLYLTAFPVVNFGGTPLDEAWAHAFLLLGLVAAVRGSVPWLAAASLVGMFAKETTLLLVPAVVVLAGPLRVKLRNLVALAPGIALYAVFRFVLYPGGYGFPSSLKNSIENLIWRLAHGPYLWWILFAGGTAFGAMWLFAALGAWRLRRTPGHPLFRLAWLIPLVLLTPFVIGSEIGRIWFYAFPAVIPLALVVLGPLVGGARTRDA